MSKDPLGHKLLKERIERCGSVVSELLESPSIRRMAVLPKYFIATGVGSSEAHAKFFVELINQHTPTNAEYQPLSYFLKAPGETYKDSTLVVFSQGLSPNAQIAIKQAKKFQQSVIFTSKEGTRDVNQTIMDVPVESEFTLLLRVMGPMAVYLAIIQFINSHWEKSISACPQAELLSAIDQANSKVLKKNASRFMKELAKGSIILANSPTSAYAQNLAYKFTEGPFFPTPVITDYLSFSHGPFQQLVANPRPVILLKDNSKETDYLYKQLQPMLKVTKASVWEIASELPSPWNIIEYEAVLNHFILKATELVGADQINWPGKNQDASLYNVCEPLS